MTDILATTRTLLTTTAPRWQSLALGAPPDLLRRKPATAEWSALECLQHIIDVEQVFQTRLRAFLAGQDFPAFNPDAEGTATSEQTDPAGLAARFTELRRLSLAALAAVTPADLERRVRHAQLGPVTLEEMLNEWCGHDLMHTVQAERAMLQPFIEGCGPWSVYFQDHIIR